MLTYFAPKGPELPGIGKGRKPDREDVRYANRCVTVGCEGFPFKAGYCVTCGPSAPMVALLKALQDGAVLRVKDTNTMAYVYLEQPDGAVEGVETNTLEGALSRRLLVATVGSPGRWGLRLSDKALAILEEN